MPLKTLTTSSSPFTASVSRVATRAFARWSRGPNGRQRRSAPPYYGIFPNKASSIAVENEHLGLTDLLSASSVNYR